MLPTQSAARADQVLATGGPVDEATKSVGEQRHTDEHAHVPSSTEIRNPLALVRAFGAPAHARRARQCRSDRRGGPASGTPRSARLEILAASWTAHGPPETDGCL